MINRLKRLNYRHFLPDILLVAASFYFSLYLRLGDLEFPDHLPMLNRHIGLFLVLRIGTLAALGVYDIIWRYISLHDAVKLVRGVLISSVLIVAASYVVDIRPMPRAIFFIDAILITIALCGIRFARRLLQEASAGRGLKENGRITLVVGAGTNGRNLVNRYNADRDSGLRLIGFIDDDVRKIGRSIAGLKVMGAVDELPNLIEEFHVEEVLVALARPPAELLRKVTQYCRSRKIRPRLLASPTGNKSISILRDVELSDLLCRPRRVVDTSRLHELVRGKRVLVTGAGGSIGSELSRQILALRPGRLVLLDHSEFNLYQVQQELGASPFVVPVLVDMKDKASVSQVFQEHVPEIVFHAAAYKHVDLVEKNPYTSILNNVLSTQHLLHFSSVFGVERLVLISTDKAVNPAGVMGATKRVCEMMVSAAGREENRKYCSVRFGNVLGSSGSLIPLLKKQIRNGEPVTITHKDMTRYFMLIPEAVSLVLRAASLASGGDIQLLRMGEPVRIVELVKSLIVLMGKSEEEVPIVFTGLRPGEKLFEELYLCGDEIQTEDPDVLVVPGGDGISASAEVLMSEVDKMVELARKGDQGALVLLSSLVKMNNRVPPSAPELVPSRSRSRPEVTL